ncbi:hypothetical protein D9619_008844 [Psilocybe cf. subviscida]|uniref:SH3 domain-containing protein n=1 Tax=Psilocybe cf. subviscida TaxID=2480587 RepID=A0A8H5BAD3_9AGAR|nr:hypothetical protein D9619_008844 [Psilocybe cf. subviscida]
MNATSQSNSSGAASGDPPNTQTQPSEQPNTHQHFGFCRALYDYQAPASSSEISFRRGDIIEILGKEPSGWWDGLITSEPAGAGEARRGWFPSNYVVVLPPGEEA